MDGALRGPSAANAPYNAIANAVAEADNGGGRLISIKRNRINRLKIMLQGRRAFGCGSYWPARRSRREEESHARDRH
jgi:hypothetical protein